MPSFRPLGTPLLALATLSGCLADPMAAERERQLKQASLSAPYASVAPRPVAWVARRPVPSPPAGSPQALPTPPLSDPWVAQVRDGAVALLPSEPTTPATLKLLTGLAALEAEFNLATMALLAKPEILASLGATGKPVLGPEVRPDGQPLETIQAEAHFPYTGREGGVMTANTGRGASVAIRIDDGKAYPDPYSQPERSGALLVSGPSGQQLAAAMAGQPGLNGEVRLPADPEDARVRLLRYEMKGKVLELHYEVSAGRTLPAANLVRRVEFVDGFWLQSVTGSYGELPVAYTLEQNRGGGGYLMAPEGPVLFTTLDANLAHVGPSFPRADGKPERAVMPFGEDPTPTPSVLPEASATPSFLLPSPQPSLLPNPTPAPVASVAAPASVAPGPVVSVSPGAEPK